MTPIPHSPSATLLLILTERNISRGLILQLFTSKSMKGLCQLAKLSCPWRTVGVDKYRL
nr:uncharacterized protein CTRU02_02966 [Colletotrichum truncatum]KAF6797924.1 hypothetical protein CTRU02_02966 [Colletotrichum truncatum]